MNASELRAMSSEDLQRECQNRVEELFNLRFRCESEQLDNPLQLRALRRDIARIKTILAERAREAS